MRSPQLYGLLLGLAQILATLLVYAASLHSGPDSLEAANRFENIGAFAAMMAALILGLRAARRTQSARGLPVGVGTGLRAACVISALGGLVNALGQYLYVAYMNPAFAEHLRTVIVRNAALPPEQAAVHQAQLDLVCSPLFRALSQGGTTLVFGIFVGAACAFLLRDPAPAPAPPAA